MYILTNRRPFSVLRWRGLFCRLLLLLTGNLFISHAVYSQCFDVSLTPSLFASYPALNEPNSLAAGDFNGDNVSDLVICHYRAGTNFSILVYFGSTSGGLSAPTAYSIAGNNPAAVAVAVGDFNGDAKPDIARFRIQFRYFDIFK